MTQQGFTYCGDLLGAALEARKPEENIGEPWGAWGVLGAALEARKSNYYCKFSPELRITPKSACKIGAKKSRFHGALR